MTQNLPDKTAILDFLREAPPKTGKREIARAFGLKGAQRIALKALLAEMAEEGLIAHRRKRLGTREGLPPVSPLEVHARDRDGELLARPVTWDSDDPAPRIIVIHRKGDLAAGIGDRILARIRPVEGEDHHYEARVMRKIGGARRILGVYRIGEQGGRLVPVSKKSRDEWRVEPGDSAGARDGELVEAETIGKGGGFGLARARIVERLGDLTAPRSISLIAIHEHDLPVVFSDAALTEAEAAAPIESPKGREDLRSLPFVTIDPADARDHDDALFAEPDPDHEGGWIVRVAIADVAAYVTPGSALDRDARLRGNSAYFPDRVVPMLPERLSGDLCSLHEGVARPVMALRMVIGPDGEKREHRFMRGLIRSAASLTYEQAQAAHEGRPDDATGPLMAPVIEPLFGAWKAVHAARARRAPLDLDLPERQVVLDEDGTVTAIRHRERFDAHRLVEDFMVLANVCAAETLEAARTPLLYRVHEPPNEERVDALREMLDDIGIPLTKGQRMTPAMLNRALDAAAAHDSAEMINIAVLRAQTQAYYSPENHGHFGLNLARYAHFTSPIRRYADLVVHRALIAALSMEGWRREGQGTDQAAALEETGAHISDTERRAMLAERDSTDRYLAAYLADRVGAEFDGVVSGVARFGLFVKLDETGADGLLPVSALGAEYFHHDAEAQVLEARGGARFALGDRLRVRLVEAVPVTGGLLFERADAGPGQHRDTARRPDRKTARKTAAKKAKQARKAKRPR